MAKEKSVGLTMDAGWQVGIRRTFPIKAHDAWEFLLSPEGMALWLGKVKAMEWAVGKSFKTSSGIEGTINTFKPNSHMRMSWRKKGWDHFSMLQPRIMKGVGRSVISFHHDRLTDAEQRAEMKVYWSEVMDKLESVITNKRS
jgi:uncharacterized protein YndB with AHSA1/START domain